MKTLGAVVASIGCWFFGRAVVLIAQWPESTVDVVRHATVSGVALFTLWMLRDLQRH